MKTNLESKSRDFLNRNDNVSPLQKIPTLKVDPELIIT